MKIKNGNANKLFIIGNGFDLAHGLKTKYEDFIEWYLKSLSKRPERIVDDGIIRTSHGINLFFNSIEDSLSEIITNKSRYELEFSNPYFIPLIKNAKNKNWVDIEQQYFEILKSLYRNFERTVNYNEFIQKISSLNKIFDLIKENFIEYISQLNKNIQIIEDINSNLYSTLEPSILSPSVPKSILFLDFNYTSTISIYPKHFSKLYDYKNISIHGNITNNDDIIFGYGDEDDPLYEKLERLNDNEVLNNFKSFWYMKNNNYQILSNFIDSFDFDVYIMGHSCGVSDRVLLSSIFSHQNCNKIQIFYHQKSETENDFFEKTQQISRHFKAGMKHEMRKRIVPFSESNPLVSYKK